MPSATSSHAQENLRRGFIQCGQCTEEFAKSTLICRRCNRVNSRSPLVIGLKFLALVAFVCTVGLLVRFISGAERFPTVDEISRATDRSPAAPAQADVRF